MKHNFLIWSLPVTAAAMILVEKPFPVHINWELVVIVAVLASLDEIIARRFSVIRFTPFLVVIGLLIFADCAEYYWVFILIHHLQVMVKKGLNGLTGICSVSMHVILMVSGMEIYQQFSQPSYLARFVTLALLLLLNILLILIYFVFRTGYLTVAPLLSSFVPIVFELAVVFPFLSMFKVFNFNLILVLFVLYYIFTAHVHSCFMKIGEREVRELQNGLKEKYGLKILFMDLKDMKGLYYPSQNMIVIDEKLDYPEQLQTLIHECIHYKLRGGLKLSKPLEELLVLMMEGLYSWYYILTLPRRPSR